MEPEAREEYLRKVERKIRATWVNWDEHEKMTDS